MSECMTGRAMYTVKPYNDKWAVFLHGAWITTFDFEHNARTFAAWLNGRSE
jgi:hypothetical protein